MHCTETELAALKSRLASARHVAIFTHQRPDPDALGSQAAMGQIIRKLQPHNPPSVSLMHFAEPPRQYAFLQDGLTAINQTMFTPAWASGAGATIDTIVVVDTCTYNQLEPAREYLKQHHDRIAALDHHLTRDHLGPVMCIDTLAAACVEIIWRFAKYSGVAMDQDVALPLMAGLVGDTGWFRFDSVRAETHLMAADLTPHVNVNALYERLMQNETKPKLALMRAALDSLVFACDDTFALMSLTQRDFSDNGAAQSQTEYLVDMPMIVGTTNVVALLSETPEGKVRASLRSKRDVDVNAVCKRFGGGGHARASGCRFDVPLAEAREKLIAAVAEEIQKHKR